jgi:hypothetical protein
MDITDTTIDPADRPREIQRDIERTRDEMDRTLTALEERLSPEQLLQGSAGMIRNGISQLGASARDAVGRHPVPFAAAAVIVGARFALRSSAHERQRRQAAEDLDRTWRVLVTALETARERSRTGRGRLEDVTRDVADAAGWYARRFLERGGQDLAKTTRAVGTYAERRPFTALALLGLTVAAGLYTRRFFR